MLSIMDMYINCEDFHSAECGTATTLRLRFGCTGMRWIDLAGFKNAKAIASAINEAQRDAVPDAGVTGLAHSRGPVPLPCAENGNTAADVAQMEAAE